MAEDKTYNDVYDYITTEETNYKTRPVPITDGWDFLMHDHFRKVFMMKNSKFWKGNNDMNRPYKNIVRPILNVAYRSEGFDVKDIVPYVDDDMNDYKSFLVKKFHPRWARKNDMDTFIDDLVENSVDYDFVLVKNVNDIRPEVIQPQAIAFCDQTDVMSGPICIRHQFSPDQISEFKDKWDSDAIDMAITQSKSQKIVSTVGKQEAKTPGKYIEVFELHGALPETWLNKAPTKNEDGSYTYDNTYDDDKKYVNQMQIVTYYTDQNNKKCGITLFKGKEPKSIFKCLVVQKVFGRAVGYGGVESLFDPQVWTNYSEIQLKEMLDVASMIILQTADETFEQKNNVTDLKKGAIVTHKENMPLEQVGLQPTNINLFNDAVARWQDVARTTGSANDAQLGEKPATGTPFKLQDLVVQQGEGIHEYRQGKISTFLAEIYRDWILQYLVDDMNKGDKWVEELSLEEMQYIAEKIAVNEVNKGLIRSIENGDDVSAATSDVVAQVAKAAFMSGGNRKFLEVIKNELADIPVDVEINIAGKQKDLNKMSDQLTNIFRQIIVNPAVLKIPGIAKIFNEILEASGLSAVDFSSLSGPSTPGQDPTQDPNAQVPQPGPNQNGIKSLIQPGQRQPVAVNQ